MPLAEPLQQVDRTFVLHRGRKLSYFGGCDYFRLASHPKVIKALHRGADEFGINVAASRSTTGNHVLYSQLEEALANFFGAEAALLVASGYATNLVVMQALARDCTHVLMDERSHGSLVDAAHLAFGARTITSARTGETTGGRNHPRSFSHRNVSALSSHVKRLGANAKIILLTDGMFSHDGSAAPLREYLRVLPRDGLVLVDDAHGAGVLGAQGKGTPEHAEIDRRRVIQTISLSKAFGCYGGAVLCSRKRRDEIIERSRFFNGNTPLPLPLANASLTSVRLLKQNPNWRARMNANAARVKTALRNFGREIPNEPGPIIPILPRDAAEAKRLQARLLKRGIFPSFIQYANSPGYFRFVISSEHKREQLDALVRALQVRSAHSTRCKC